ncbi:MAG: ABC-2 transporter permease [Lachnospiraceae bacterium]|nr:ABC-2 transporter permease [Lachnospiraceae bacterium]
MSITSDAASKWSKNVITMPVSRSQIIGEKFLFYILLALLGMLTARIPCAVRIKKKRAVRTIGRIH